MTTKWLMSNLMIMIGISGKNEFKKYKKIYPKKIQDIDELSKYVSLKIKSLSV